MAAPDRPIQLVSLCERSTCGLKRVSSATWINHWFSRHKMTGRARRGGGPSQDLIHETPGHFISPVRGTHVSSGNFI